MRRFLVVTLFAFAIFGMLAPPVFAQAPTPKVTITGLFDQVTSGGYNFYDGNYSRNGDHEWYARTRFRPDFVFEVGRTKAVMGLELDLMWGSAAPVGGGGGKGGSTVVSPSLNTAVPGGGGFGVTVKNGATADAGLNNDLAGVLELKWFYTEFDLTGKDSLLPFINVPTVARAGGQPFASIANMREYALFAAGDFAGAAATTTWAPNLVTKFAYVLIDDEIAQANRGSVFTSGAKLTKGNDFAILASPEYNVFKGLDVKGLWAYVHGEGSMTGSARRGAADRNVGGSYSNAALNGTTANCPGVAANCASAAGATTASGVTFGGPNVLATGAIVANGTLPYLNGQPNLNEERYTLGFEARYRMGPFGLDPAVYYQFGHRNIQAAINHNGSGFTMGQQKTDMSAWLFDTVGSFQSGPLLIEVRGIYSTGNKAHDNLSKRISYFEPLDEDTSYYTGWAQMLALGLDYFNGNGGSNAGMASNVGYDRYGRGQLGIRATYSLTPALAVYTIVSPTWTAQSVDTHTGVAGFAAGGTLQGRTIVDDKSFSKGSSNYIGTEADLGTTWKFAPNTAFDIAGGYLFVGSALDTVECVPGVAAASAGSCPSSQIVKRKAEDAWTLASRVRFAF